jgi:predicted phosphodiesterase
MGHTYAASDWHGCAGSALKLLEYLKPDDKLYYLGDATDRGPDGAMLLQKLLEDKRVVYIKGNHDFFIEICGQYMFMADPDYEFIRDYDRALADWFQNGGEGTYKAFCKMDPSEFKTQIWEKVIRMPVSAEYISPLSHKVILEHAGYTPGVTHGIHDPLWDREHFHDKWQKEYPNTYLVHGHTPVQYLKYEYGYEGQPPKTKEDILLRNTWYKEDTNFIPEVIRYADGHKFCVDLCTIVSDRVALLDLDTFDVKYFEGDENE